MVDFEHLLDRFWHYEGVREFLLHDEQDAFLGHKADRRRAELDSLNSVPEQAGGGGGGAKMMIDLSWSKK